MAVINVRIDDELKNEVVHILNDLGLTLSGAINIYLKAIVNNNGIPFNLSGKEVKREINTVASNSLVDENGKFIDWAMTKEYISASKIQRQFSLGYPKASKIIEILKEKGIIETNDTSKGYKVIK